MSEVASSSAPTEAVHPPSIDLGEEWPWTLLAGALLLLAYFVSVADSHWVHEFFHDGRHLLAFPCH
jgi:cobalt transporter subunit CbtB